MVFIEWYLQAPPAWAELARYATHFSPYDATIPIARPVAEDAVFRDGEAAPYDEHPPMSQQAYKPQQAKMDPPPMAAPCEEYAPLAQPAYAPLAAATFSARMKEHPMQELYNLRAVVGVEIYTIPGKGVRLLNVHANSPADHAGMVIDADYICAVQAMPCRT